MRSKKCVSKKHASNENTTFRYLIFERKLEFSVPQIFRQYQVTKL